MRLLLLTLALVSLTGCRSPSTLQGRQNVHVSSLWGVLEWSLAFDHTAAEPSAKEDQVGRWASQSKAGSASGTGFLPAPVAADWTVTPTGGTTANVVRSVSLPGGADGFGRLLRNNATGAILGEGAQVPGTTIAQGGLVSGDTYRWNIAWYRGTVRVSDWGDTKIATQP